MYICVEQLTFAALATKSTEATLPQALWRAIVLRGSGRPGAS
jgi:hypothetical protein